MYVFLKKTGEKNEFDPMVSRLLPIIMNDRFYAFGISSTHGYTLHHIICGDTFFLVYFCADKKDA